MKKGSIKLNIKEFLKNIALLAAVLMICLILLEIGLRIADYPEDFFYAYDSNVGIKYAPNMEGVYTKQIQEFENPIRINSYGFYDDEWQQEKNESVFRIAVLGDSFTANMAVLPEKSAWKIIEKKLNEKLEEQNKDEKSKRQNNLKNKIDRIEILNFGVNSYSTAHEYLALKHYALGFDPDLVIMNFFYNDVSRNTPSSVRQGFLIKDNENGKKLVFDKTEFAAQKTLKMKYYLRQHVKTVSLIMRVMDNLQAIKAKNLASKCIATDNEYDVFQKTYPHETDNDWMLTKAIIMLTKRLCDKNDVPFLLINIPWNPTDDQFERIKDMNPGLNRSEMDFSKPGKILGEFAGENKLNYIDLYPVMIPQEKKIGMEKLHYSYDGHWNAGGNKLAADVISDELVKKGVLPVVG